MRPFATAADAQEGGGKQSPGKLRRNRRRIKQPKGVFACFLHDLFGAYVPMRLIHPEFRDGLEEKMIIKCDWDQGKEVLYNLDAVVLKISDSEYKLRHLLLAYIAPKSLPIVDVNSCFDQTLGDPIVAAFCSINPNYYAPSSPTSPRPSTSNALAPCSLTNEPNELHNGQPPSTPPDETFTGPQPSTSTCNSIISRTTQSTCTSKKGQPKRSASMKRSTVNVKPKAFIGCFVSDMTGAVVHISSVLPAYQTLIAEKAMVVCNWEVNGEIQYNVCVVVVKISHSVCTLEALLKYFVAPATLPLRNSDACFQTIPVGDPLWQQLSTMPKSVTDSKKRGRGRPRKNANGTSMSAPVVEGEPNWRDLDKCGQEALSTRPLDFGRIGGPDYQLYGTEAGKRLYLDNKDALKHKATDGVKQGPEGVYTPGELVDSYVGLFPPLLSDQEIADGREAYAALGNYYDTRREKIAARRDELRRDLKKAGKDENSYGISDADYALILANELVKANQGKPINFHEVTRDYGSIIKREEAAKRNGEEPVMHSMYTEDDFTLKLPESSEDEEEDTIAHSIRLLGSLRVTNAAVDADDPEDTSVYKGDDLMLQRQDISSEDNHSSRDVKKVSQPGTPYSKDSSSPVPGSQPVTQDRTDGKVDGDTDVNKEEPMDASPGCSPVPGSQPKSQATTDGDIDQDTDVAKVIATDESTDSSSSDSNDSSSPVPGSQPGTQDRTEGKVDGDTDVHKEEPMDASPSCSPVPGSQPKSQATTDGDIDQDTDVAKNIATDESTDSSSSDSNDSSSPVPGSQPVTQDRTEGKVDGDTDVHKEEPMDASPSCSPVPGSQPKSQATTDGDIDKDTDVAKVTANDKSTEGDSTVSLLVNQGQKLDGIDVQVDSNQGITEQSSRLAEDLTHDLAPQIEQICDVTAAELAGILSHSQSVVDELSLGFTRDSQVSNPLGSNVNGGESFVDLLNSAFQPVQPHAPLDPQYCTAQPENQTFVNPNVNYPYAMNANAQQLYPDPPGVIRVPAYYPPGPHYIPPWIHHMNTYESTISKITDTLTALQSQVVELRQATQGAKTTVPPATNNSMTSEGALDDSGVHSRLAVLQSTPNSSASQVLIEDPILDGDSHSSSLGDSSITRNMRTPKRPLVSEYSSPEKYRRLTNTKVDIEDNTSTCDLTVSSLDDSSHKRTPKRQMESTESSKDKYRRLADSIPATPQSHNTTKPGTILGAAEGSKANRNMVDRTPSSTLPHTPRRTPIPKNALTPNQWLDTSRSPWGSTSPELQALHKFRSINGGGADVAAGTVNVTEGITQKESNGPTSCGGATASVEELPQLDKDEEEIVSESFSSNSDDDFQETDRGFSRRKKREKFPSKTRKTKMLRRIENLREDSDEFRDDAADDSDNTDDDTTDVGYGITRRELRYMRRSSFTECSFATKIMKRIFSLKERMREVNVAGRGKTEEGALREPLGDGGENNPRIQFIYKTAIEGFPKNPNRYPTKRRKNRIRRAIDSCNRQDRRNRDRDGSRAKILAGKRHR